MVSEIQRLQEQSHHNDYLHLGASAYSLFVLAIRSPQTEVDSKRAINRKPSKREDHMDLIIRNYTKI